MSNPTIQLTELQKFKKLLEYFVAHLEYYASDLKDSTIKGYDLVKDLKQGEFTGKGHEGYKIQERIKQWDTYNNIGKICITVDFKNKGFGSGSYLVWLNPLNTGAINIIPIWNSAKKRVDNLQIELQDEDNQMIPDYKGEFYAINALGLYDDKEPNNLIKELFDEYVKQKIEFDIANNIIVEAAEILEHNHNLILSGAPGTGKTYTAKEIAKAIGADEKSIAFVQFHPSYDYTDFVEGLRPIQQNGNIVFERKDGVFKQFCKKALKNYEDNDADVKQVEKEKRKNFVFIIDEINRGEISKIFGELFFSIDPGYRGEKGRVKTQYQNLIDDDNDVFSDGFYVPENVYIIGTMNNIDRSVESMDFAMRRRFAWKEITAQDSQVIIESSEIINEVDGLKSLIINRMNNLNQDIISDDINLSKDYQIGAAYFKKIEQYITDNFRKKGNKTPDTKPLFNKLWTNHLVVVLRDYLRGEENAEDKLDKLKEAYNDDPKH